MGELKKEAEISLVKRTIETLEGVLKNTVFTELFCLIEKKFGFILEILG